MGLDSMGAALKKAGLATSAQEYVDRRTSLTELVSNNMFQNQITVGSAQKGDYFIVNYMRVPNMTNWLAYEKRCGSRWPSRWRKMACNAGGR